MKVLLKGERIIINNYCNLNDINIEIKAQGKYSQEYDISCFALDSENKCSDDRYMIFYNQKISPCKSISLLDSIEKNHEIFKLNLNKIPDKIKSLVFTLSIDTLIYKNDNMSNILECSIAFLENNKFKFVYKFDNKDFKDEKSIIIAEIYFNNQWKFVGKGVGFNGGLSSLLEYFGIDEEKDEDINILNNNINNNFLENELEKTDKKTLSKLVKNVILTPFKYLEKKRIEKIEKQKIIEIQQIEINKKIENQNKFRELLLEYISDGILTDNEMSNLKIFCKNNNLDIDYCISLSKFEVENFLHLLLANIISDSIVTKEEEEMINSVCKFLKPSNHIISEIKNTIDRVKKVSSIKNGEVTPIINPKIITKIDEIVWYHHPEVRLYRELKKDYVLYTGDIYVTNERIIFRSQNYPLEILIKNIIEIEVKTSCIYIIGRISKASCKLILNDSEILGAYIEQSINKFHRKINFSTSNNNNRVIPQLVRQQVWIRDQGKCVECSATDYLEYDHIIPFSKGGSNSINNIQLLCRRCNLKKSNRI